MEKKGFVIAIDGPVAAGKGTIAQLLAKKLHAHYLTTGLLYRSVTLYCLDHTIALSEEKQVKKVLPEIAIEIRNERVFLNEQDVTDRLMTRVVDESVPIIANYASVRAHLLPVQREIGLQQVQQGKIVILEGRDIATKIFPDALVKIYLTSDVAVRAKRRFAQMQKRLGTGVHYEDVLRDTKQRDERDMYGPLAYLVANPQDYGYTVVDDSDLTEAQTLEKILGIIAEKERLAFRDSV
jgi:cytidylate kinase